MGRRGEMVKKNITKNASLLLDQNQTRLMDSLTMEVIIEAIMIEQAIIIITKTITDLIIIEAIEEASTIEIILMKTQGRVIKVMKRQEIQDPVTTMKIHPEQTLRIQSQVMHMKKSQGEEI